MMTSQVRFNQAQQLLQAARAPRREDALLDSMTQDPHAPSPNTLSMAAMGYAGAGKPGKRRGVDAGS